jgi:predicted metal-dependent phosphoesterase TrpH
MIPAESRDHHYADLQLHSSASDGSDPPPLVVRRAAALRFAAIALTDHDTMDGVPAAQEAADALGIELISGCELSTLDGERQVDLLAYGTSPQDAEFAAVLATLRGGRLGRAWSMVQKLNELGYPVSWTRVQEIAGSENVGRPHVALAMVEAGVVGTVKAAFTAEFIGDGGRCYVQRVKISPEQGIRAVHAAGGVAVAAHPGRTGLTDSDIERLTSAGLDGLEAYYPQHLASDTARFLQRASEHRLLVTGGSDDHGTRHEGQLMGSICLPYEYVERLKAAIACRSSAVAPAASAS